MMLRIFLDTNVYILGAADPCSDAAQLLKIVEKEYSPHVTLILSEPLLEQILRVGRRIQNKDWSGALVQRIWNCFNWIYVSLDAAEMTFLLEQAMIPREDVEMYMTAKTGQAHLFVSENRVLMRSLIQETQEFRCLSVAECLEQFKG